MAEKHQAHNLYRTGAGRYTLSDMLFVPNRTNIDQLLLQTNPTLQVDAQGALPIANSRSEALSLCKHGG